MSENSEKRFSQFAELKVMSSHLVLCFSNKPSKTQRYSADSDVKQQNSRVG